MERGVRFEFKVFASSAPVPSHVSLAWYRQEADFGSSEAVHGLGGLGGQAEGASLPTLPVRAGEHWRFTVRLKRPHGNVNPHGFDYEAWLFERGIRATGYVRAKADLHPERLPEADLPVSSVVGRTIDVARDHLRERYRNKLGEAPYGGILIALAMGDQQAIAPELWQVFAKTGITHLMSISGLHVTMLAGLAYAAMNWLWRRSVRLPLYVPAQQAAAVAGFVTALTYCLLAGFAVPAQRTLYMLGVVALAIVLRRELSASRVLAFALLVVLLIDPWAVLAAGFWLSFGAVALLFFATSGRFTSGRLNRRSESAGRYWRGFLAWGWAQWAVTLGMLPALLALFQQFSLVSPLANAVAIPLISFVVTPLTLAGIVPGLDVLLHVAHGATAILMGWVESLALKPWAVWQQAAPPGWAVVLALVGGLWSLMPRGIPARWLGLLCFLPLLTFAPERPASGSARVAVLDVGQGLAVHVQTRTHDLLFDTGPAFSAEADSGNRLIVPYLRAAGVRKLDRLVVSHRDKDHEGGAVSVLSAVPVVELLTSLPFEHPLSAWPVPQQQCVDGQEWEWDGVRFEVLHPPPNLIARKSNAVSCVLRIVAAGQEGASLLLASDIEAEQESALVGRRSEVGRGGRGYLLTSDILVVPHHGSRTSSTPEFIRAVAAKDAIFTVGYRNRYGHPKEEVVERYSDSGARLHRTDSDGALLFDLSASPVQVEHQRQKRQRYWMGR
jgi:competence protein ComEC